MTEFSTQAFGKLFLAGEYSILLGSPALITAVKKPAVSKITYNKPNNYYTKTTTKKTLSNDNDLINTCIKEAQNLGLKIPQGEILLDTSSLFNQENQRKLGLGSSAAAIASLIKLLFFYNNIFDVHKIFETSKDIHKKLFGKNGSCGDIAASLFGSISYKVNGKENIKPFFTSWFTTNVVIINTNISQDTKSFLDAFSQFKKYGDPWLNEFERKTTTIIECILKKPRNFEKMIEFFNELAINLEILGQKANIPIMSKPHQAIKECANLFGGSAKPSGAGGGDCSVVFLEKARHDEFKNAIDSLGFEVLSLEFINGNNF